MVFKTSMQHQVKSAGTSIGARVKLNEKHLTWADLIFVMEDKHRQLIKQRFSSAYDAEKVVLLDVPDDFQYMDEELIFILKTTVSPYLE